MTWQNDTFASFRRLKWPAHNANGQSKTSSFVFLKQKVRKRYKFPKNKRKTSHNKLSKLQKQWLVVSTESTSQGLPKASKRTNTSKHVKGLNIVYSFIKARHSRKYCSENQSKVVPFEIWTYSKFRQLFSCSELCYLRGFSLLDATDPPNMPKNK